MSYQQKLSLLIDMRLSPPNAKAAKARKDIAEAMIKETPRLAEDLERFEKGLRVWEATQ